MHIKIVVFLFSLLFGTTNVSAEDKITVYMAGDSTMSIKDPKDYPETGWGEPFATFFDHNKIKVVNLAKNGRSTKTFKSEGLWRSIIDNIKANDVVFIQFGHNDQSVNKKERYTTPAQYTNNIQQMINQARAKQANVILLSPVSRRHFDTNGLLKRTHPYADHVRKIAKDNPDVVFIDMEQISYDWITQLGDDLSSLRFMHIKPNTHPNYPNGLKDNTHFNELGAREVAQFVLKELMLKKHELTKHLRPVDPKHLNYSY